MPWAACGCTAIARPCIILLHFKYFHCCLSSLKPIRPPLHSSLLQAATRGRTLARSYQLRASPYSTMAENNGPGAPAGEEPAIELTEKQLKKAAKKDAKKAKFDKKVEALKKGQQQATPTGDVSLHSNCLLLLLS